MGHQSKTQILLAIAITALMVFILSETVNAETLDHNQVDKICKRYEYKDCFLVSAIVWTESSYRVQSFNEEKNGSYGLMQVQCGTAKMVGLKFGCEQLFNKNIGIRFGIKYLQLIEERLKTNKVENILAAWNAGMKWDKENGYQNVTCKNYNRFTWSGLPPVECYPGEFINQEYVWKTLRRYKYLRSKYESRISSVRPHPSEVLTGDL